MLQKTLLALIALIGYSVLDCQACQAQRQKRGLLTKPEAEKEAPATPATAPATDTPATTQTPKTAESPQPADATKPAATKADEPLDLFEMAAKNSAAKEAAAKEAVEGLTDEKAEDKPAPPPEMLTLKSDGILIKAAFFASPNADNPKLAKLIVPVMLLHDWGGSMNDMGQLAKYLQSIGHTVIVPDLRGHGGSVTMQGSNVKLDYEDFNRAEIATVKRDFEECKKKLITYNNEGKLNISMLSVVAVGETCMLATEWAINDWGFRPVGGVKQGQDVQSLVFVSPAKKFQQSTMSKLVRHPLLSGAGGFSIPTLVIYSQDSRSYKDIHTMYRSMERKRLPSQQTDPKLRWAEQDLFALEVRGDEEGSELLSSNPNIFRFIGQFDFYKISRNADNFPWASRARK